MCRLAASSGEQFDAPLLEERHKARLFLRLLSRSGHTSPASVSRPVHSRASKSRWDRDRSQDTSVGEQSQQAFGVPCTDNGDNVSLAAFVVPCLLMYGPPLEHLFVWIKVHAHTLRIATRDLLIKAARQHKVCIGRFCLHCCCCCVNGCVFTAILLNSERPYVA